MFTNDREVVLFPLVNEDSSGEQLKKKKVDHRRGLLPHAPRHGPTKWGGDGSFGKVFL